MTLYGYVLWYVLVLVALASALAAADLFNARRTPPADDPTPTTHVDEFGLVWGGADYCTPEVTPLERGRR